MYLNQANPMVLSTYGGDEENMGICMELGFSIFQTDSDHLGINENEDGSWDWKFYDECAERIHQAGQKWMFFPHFAFHLNGSMSE
jgi:hypothetical protein